jgi:DNA-binding transcriptional LysR family regulator
MTESAEKLHIAQPALSQAIKRLEEDIGVPLFAKKGRNIVLTEYGEYLKEELVPVMEKLDKLPEILRDMAQNHSDVIHLEVSAASTLITNAIIEYKTNRRDSNFQLFQTETSEAVDIEITTKMFYRPGGYAMKNQFVCNEKIFLAVPNGGKYKGKKSISLKNVENEGFISLLGSKQFRYICDKFCTHIGVKPNIIFESDNPTAVKNMIAANIGVGFWPEFTWGKIDSDRVLLLEIEDFIFSRDIVITCNKNKVDDLYVEDFFEFLKEYFTSAKENARG